MGDPRRFDDLFAEFGPIGVRRFFGGEGIYAGDVMIGLVFGDTIYFTTDVATRAAFKAENCRPFTFKKGGETIVTHWHAIPDRLYDDPDELAGWARVALKVGEASPIVAKKRRKAGSGAARRKGRQIARG